MGAQVRMQEAAGKGPVELFSTHPSHDRRIASLSPGSPDFVVRRRFPQSVFPPEPSETAAL